MIKPVIGGFDEFEFVLDVSFVVFLFEGSDDLVFGVDFDGGFGGIHEFYKVLKIHLNLFGLQIVMHFDDKRYFQTFLFGFVLRLE